MLVAAICLMFQPAFSAPPNILLIAAADIPAQALATKGASIFSDDFNHAELGGAWRIGTPTFSIIDGILQGGQTGPGHSAVGFVKVGCKDVIVEFKMRFDRAKSINAVFNDKDYKGGHAGHICRVSFLPGRIFLADDKERLRRDIEELRKDPKRKAEADKLVQGRTLGFPNKLDPSKWYRVRIELLGDELRVCLDDRPVAYLKSSGIDHALKREFYFAVAGASAQFDDLHIWNAQRAGK